MTKDQSKSTYKVNQRRGWIFLRIIFLFVLVILVSVLTITVINLRQKEGPDKKDLLQMWSAGSYEDIYKLSGEQLLRKPLDNFLLTIHGFAAYQIAIAQIDNFSMLSYIDNCIWSLRKALLSKDAKTDGSLFYVLGKAYYYKGAPYSDLAIKYLEKADETGYRENDIPEYLGLAYINIKDYRSSVAAFANALKTSISDVLLLSIANSYIALGEDDAAYAYLTRCAEISKDSGMIFSARLSMGDIQLRRGDYNGAEEQFITVNNDSGGNADACYRLGELYNSRGETVRARAEWRRAVQIDPAYMPARARLNM
ncbi:MAG: hypothetical protein FWD78_07550 [Treponema sp.]|nr:hypothetical protein [Treponema sp.]